MACCRCSSLIGMISYGWLSDRYHRPMLLASCYFVRALTFIMLIYIAGNPALLYVFAILFGIFDYATFPIVASIVATHISRHIMGLTMGLDFLRCTRWAVRWDRSWVDIFTSCSPGMTGSGSFPSRSPSWPLSCLS